MTNSDNETIAAYIYFDGRAKEEVATLLRPGEETWVNSRWVQVPDSEGGGLAEREFLFREVSLEKWLNGLDLQGHDAAEKLERRRQKFERRRRRQRFENNNGEMEAEQKLSGTRDTLRYGADDGSPVEAVFEGGESDSLSSDDELPEATGQIKVAMFRVIASGEIKKGEYSPQFDAHDDDDEEDGANKGPGGGSMEADVEHTTSFAKPKTLDPKTISTQTVTGIDGPDKPYATFTFFYRGERQLQKMGLLSPQQKQAKAATSSTKRRSGQLDFSALSPLKTTGTVGFSTFRDRADDSTRKPRTRKSEVGTQPSMLEDSDEDEETNEILRKMADAEDKDVETRTTAEDAKSQGELAEGLGRIRLKRQHSAEPDHSIDATAFQTPSGAEVGVGNMTPPDGPGSRQVNAPTHPFSKALPEDSVIGSPLKKHRASIHGTIDKDQTARATAFPLPMGDILAKAEAAQGRVDSCQPTKENDDEEL